MHLDLSAFLDHLATTQKSPLTVRRYDAVLHELEASTEGAEPAAFTTEVLRRFAAAPRRDGSRRSPAGVNLRVAVVRALFTYLTLERGYDTNPALRVVGVKEPRRLPKYLTTNEAVRLVEHVHRERGALRLRDVALVVLFWQVGLRVAEVARLRLDQLDRKARLLRSVLVKGGHELDFALNDETLAALEQYLVTRGDLPGDAPLFATREGGRLSVRAIEARFEAWRSELGWTRPLHPHLMRHTFATGLLDEGAEIGTVAELLGHAGLATVLVYAKVQDAARRAALAKLGTRVPRAILTAGTPVDLSTTRLPPPAPPANDVSLTDFSCEEGGFDAIAA